MHGVPSSVRWMEKVLLKWDATFPDRSFAPAQKGRHSRQNETWQGHEVDGTGRRSKVFRWEFRCRFSQVIECVIKKLLDAVGLFEAAQLAQLSGRECGQGVSPVRMDCNLSRRVPTTEKPCRAGEWDYRPPRPSNRIFRVTKRMKMSRPTETFLI
jgi:hypothetical protein